MERTNRDGGEKEEGGRIFCRCIWSPIQFFRIKDGWNEFTGRRRIFSQRMYSWCTFLQIFLRDRILTSLLFVSTPFKHPFLCRKNDENIFIKKTKGFSMQLLVCLIKLSSWLNIFRHVCVLIKFFAVMFTSISFFFTLSRERIKNRWCRVKNLKIYGINNNSRIEKIFPKEISVLFTGGFENLFQLILCYIIYFHSSD